MFFPFKRIELGLNSIFSIFKVIVMFFFMLVLLLPVSSWTFLEVDNLILSPSSIILYKAHKSSAFSTVNLIVPGSPDCKLFFPMIFILII